MKIKLKQKQIITTDSILKEIKEQKVFLIKKKQKDFKIQVKITNTKHAKNIQHRP